MFGIRDARLPTPGFRSSGGIKSGDFVSFGWNNYVWARLCADYPSEYFHKASLSQAMDPKFDQGPSRCNLDDNNHDNNDNYSDNDKSNDNNAETSADGKLCT